LFLTAFSEGGSVAALRQRRSTIKRAPLAQLVEQVTLNHKVPGSIPGRRTRQGPSRALLHGLQGICHPSATLKIFDGVAGPESKVGSEVVLFWLSLYSGSLLFHPGSLFLHLPALFFAQFVVPAHALGITVCRGVEQPSPITILVVRSLVFLNRTGELMYNGIIPVGVDHP
jgi:hypothetical protein